MFFILLFLLNTSAGGRGVGRCTALRGMVRHGRARHGPWQSRHVRYVLIQRGGARNTREVTGQWWRDQTMGIETALQTVSRRTIRLQSSTESFE